MKKLMTIGTALALALTLSATGCKKKQDDAAKTDTTNKKPAEPTGTPTPAPATGSAAAPATGSAAPTDPAATGSAAPATGSAAPTDPAAAASTGVPECDEYLATVAKAAQCDKFGPARDAVQKSADAWKTSTASWASLDDAGKKAAQSAAATTCKAASDGVKTTATGLGCTL